MRQIVVAAHQLQGVAAEPEDGRIDVRRRVAPLAETCTAYPQVEQRRRRQCRGVADGDPEIGPVVEALRDRDAVDDAVAGRVLRVLRPVVAVFLALVPVAGRIQAVGRVEVVIDTTNRRVVVVGTQLVREVVADRARTVRERIQRGVHRRDGIDTKVGNLFVVERQPGPGRIDGERIVDLSRELAEIPLPHQERWHGVGCRFGLHVTQMLERRHEERAVAKDGAAHGAGVAVVLAGRLRATGALRQQWCGGAGIVAIEIAGGAPDRVGAAPQGEVDDRASGMTTLRIERAGLHLELRDGVGRRREADPLLVRHVGGAVDGELVPPCAPLATMPPRLPLSAGRAKCRSEGVSRMPGASRVSM